MSESTCNVPSPNMALIKMARGYMLSMALRAAAELGIADLLHESPKSPEELAGETSIHAPSLYRLLRALAGEGIFHENPQGCFENTTLSGPLRTDAPDSVRDNVLYIPHDGNVLAWTRFMDTLETGNPSFEDATGLPAWEYLREHPDLERSFDQSMTRLTAIQCKSIAAQCDFSTYRTIIDIGGGQGMLLTEILNAWPRLRGTLLEQSSTAARAKACLEEKGISHHIEIVVGDFFEYVPKGYDVYIMKQILHNWPNDDGQSLLVKCREAIPEHGKLIIFDALIVPGNAPHPDKWVDLHMLVTLGGGERTAEEFDTLLSRAGFKMTKAVPLEYIGMVEAMPV